MNQNNFEMRAIALTAEMVNLLPQSLLSLVVITADGQLVTTREAKTANVIVFNSTEQKLKAAGFIKGSTVLVSQEEFNALQNEASSMKPDEIDHSDMQREIVGLIEKGVAAHASDIHIVVKNGRTIVLFRCLGDLDPENKPRMQQSADWGMSAMRCIYQSMTDVSGIQFSTTEPQDASMDRERLPDSLFGGRIATTPIFGGHYMVIRLLYSGASAKTLQELGYNRKQIACIEYAMSVPYGIILLAGTTGSGKTTTLASCLEKKYTDAGGQINIVTVEDPVEFILPGRQLAVTAENDEGRAQAYGRAVKAMMRLDPDVGMISELRDRATIEQAIQLALTGHQVFSTVHAIDTTSILPRMEMYGVSREILADNKLITALVAQSLVKKLCDHCKVKAEEKASESNNWRYMDHLAKCEIDTARVYYRGSGCEKCNQTGYDGRTVLAEVVIPDAKYMQHYRDGDRIKMRDHAFKTSNWVSRHQHAREKIDHGIVDPRDVEAAIGPLTSDLYESDSVVSMSEIVTGA